MPEIGYCVGTSEELLSDGSVYEERPDETDAQPLNIWILLKDKVDGIKFREEIEEKYGNEPIDVVINVDMSVPIIVGTNNDINDDGKVDLSDAQLALNASLKLVELSPEAIAKGDLNGNGIIDQADVQSILRIALAIQ